MVAYMAAQGKTNAEIAELLEIDISTVRSRLSDERIQFEVKHLRYKLFGKDHKKRFMDILPHAIDVTENTLLDKNSKSSLRFAAAQEVMDRALGKPKQTMEHEGSLIRALFDKMDGKQEKPVIDVEAVGPKLIDNPNGMSIPDISSNPNLSKDSVDEWVNKNL